MPLGPAKTDQLLPAPAACESYARGFMGLLVTSAGQKVGSGKLGREKFLQSVFPRDSWQQRNSFVELASASLALPCGAGRQASTKYVQPEGMIADAQPSEHENGCDQAKIFLEPLDVTASAAIECSSRR